MTLRHLNCFLSIVQYSTVLVQHSINLANIDYSIREDY